MNYGALFQRNFVLIFFVWNILIIESYASKVQARIQTKRTDSSRFGLKRVQK